MPGNTKITEKSGDKIKVLQQYPGKHLQAVSKPERSEIKPEFSVVSSADTIWGSVPEADSKVGDFTGGKT